MQVIWLNIDVQRVRRLIEGQGLKQWWVAEAAGIHKTTLRRWLNGKIERVNEERLRRLAEVLGASAAYLAEPSASRPSDPRDIN